MPLNPDGMAGELHIVLNRILRKMSFKHSNYSESKNIDFFHNQRKYFGGY